MKIILWGIVIYFLYRFVFDLVVPVSKATGQMKQKIQEMQESQQQEQQIRAQQEQKAKEQNMASATGEYIDFEEVK